MQEIINQCRASTAPPKGILAQLALECGGNVAELDLVEIMASESNTFPEHRAQNACDIRSPYAFVSIDEPDQWIGYDFRTMTITPARYLIRSANVPQNSSHLRSWVIEGVRPEGGEPIELDRRENIMTLNGPNILVQFRVTTTVPVRLIRLRQIDLNWSGSNTLFVSYFDIIGEISQNFPRQPPSIPRPPVGLFNLGCTCYMNAAVQALFRVTPLTEYVLSPQFERDINPANPLGSGSVVARAYRALIAQLSVSADALSARALKDVVGAHNELFADFGQHDAHEFFVVLLDFLHEDLNRSPRAMGDDRDLSAMSGMILHRFCNQSKISDLFHGETRTTLVFHCGNQEVIDEPLVSWGIPLPHGQGVVSLHECISQWELSEHLCNDNSLWCSRCNGVEGVYRQAAVWRFAPILVIHLRRFKESGGQVVKNEAIVRYPVAFNAHDYAKAPGFAHGVYDLIAVVCHTGTLSGGHYWCILRDRMAMDVWYSVSDAIVHRVDASAAQQDTAFVIVYEARR
jgi:ubiquitin C-terminal hydrolase